jgi:hypothetical protein
MTYFYVPLRTLQDRDGIFMLLRHRGKLLKRQKLPLRKLVLTWMRHVDFAFTHEKGGLDEGLTDVPSRDSHSEIFGEVHGPILKK